MTHYASTHSVPMILMCLLSAILAKGANTIHVPADQPTIQAAINAASNGDTVLVSAGTYAEAINFNGKAITVKSSNGPSVTTIAVPASTAGVTFDHAETSSSVLKGFTIQGANYTVGIIVESAPTILGNLITGNHWCDGAGIYISGGASPIIRENKILNNYHDLCSGGQGGGGIAIVGQASAQIIGNLISGNDGGNGFAGGGISLWAAGTPVIMNNIIKNNTIGGQGGGLGIAACCENPIIVQNIFIGNSAQDGAAVYSSPDSGAPVFVNNSIVDNKSTSGNSVVYTNSSPGEPTLLYNNIIVDLKQQVALFCGNINTATLPVINSNDVYAPEGNTYGGACADQTGTDGNISADPLFVGIFDLHLRRASPAIDAGDNSAPDLPATDFAGNPRIINGNGGTTAIVDMGAYEFCSRSPRPEELGVQVAGYWKHHAQGFRLREEDCGDEESSGRDARLF